MRTVYDAQERSRALIRARNGKDESTARQPVAVFCRLPVGLGHWSASPPPSTVDVAADDDDRLAITVAAPPVSSTADLEPHTVRRWSGVGRGVGETPAASRPAIVVSFFLTTTYVVLLYRLCGSTAVKLDGPFYIIYACRYPNACACGSRVCYNNIITLYYIM